MDTPIEYAELQKRLSMIEEAAQKVIDASSFKSMPAGYSLDEEKALRGLKRILDGEPAEPEEDRLSDGNLEAGGELKMIGDEAAKATDEELDLGSSESITMVWRVD